MSVISIICVENQTDLQPQFLNYQPVQEVRFKIK